MGKKNDMNKPNKKTYIIGLVMLILGICTIIVRIFAVKETFLGIIGFILILFGLSFASIGKFGYQNVVEMTTAYDRERAKNIAKGIKEGLKDEEK